MIEKIDQLQSHGFRIDRILQHNDIVPFLKEFIRKKNFFTLFLASFCILIFVVLATIIILALESNQINYKTVFSYFSYGCFATFLLIPLHEIIHAIAYKMCGAQKVSFDVNWKKLYFMAIADMFVANRKQFYFVGLAPFTFISLALLIALLFVSVKIQISILTIILVHASMCSGDFGLLSYFLEQRNKEVLTFDDRRNGVSYFLIK